VGQYLILVVMMINDCGTGDDYHCHDSVTDDDDDVDAGDDYDYDHIMVVLYYPS